MQVDIERSGGFGGLTLHASVGEEQLTPGERAALERFLSQPPRPPSGPDRFVYRISLRGRQAIVQEDEIPPELRSLLERLDGAWDWPPPTHH